MVGALTKRPDSAFNVSATLVINWTALVLLARRKRETSRPAKSEEKRTFSQANS